MQKAILFIGLVLVTCGKAFSQYIAENPAEIANMKSVPMEKVYISHTGPVVFVGEYLYYSFYNLEIPSGKISKVSNLGYVHLVNNNGEVLKSHKLKLTKGRAYGDFFMDAQFPSGNYKLVGYTQWLRNGDPKAVFIGDIFLLNPYQSDQDQIVVQDTEAGMNNNDLAELDSAIVGLSLHKSSYGNREKVMLDVLNYKGYLGNGNYTLRVRKKPNILPQHIYTPQLFLEETKGLNASLQNRVGQNIWLPEQRGELIYGKVSNKFSGQPMNGEAVSISFPGRDFILKFATTDNNGMFYTYIRNPYTQDRLVAQLLNDPYTKELTIQKTDLYLPELKFEKIVLHPENLEYIKERSIHSQIENQFLIAKPDSVLVIPGVSPFEGGVPEEILLDDYTRFSTFQETLVEILNLAGYRKNKKYGDYIRIAQDFETFNEEENSLPAIVLVDGVLIPNHEIIKEYNAGFINKISLVRDKFRFAGKEYQGMMSIETKEGNFLETFQHESIQQYPIQIPFPQKLYYTETHDNKNGNQIPDYRELLHWVPVLDLKEGSIQISFFTSDISGDFEVILEGFTSYGKPIRVIKDFYVNP